MSLMRIWEQNKSDESKIKQKDDFVNRAKNQQKISVKDLDEKLLLDIVRLKGKERELKIQELRKIISK